MVAAWSGATASSDTRGTTVALTVNYLAAAQKEDIQATARVLRRGRSLIYLDVEVHSASGTLVAKGLVTYKRG
jgi:acyl-coenzyme A thioesterase PaaI-like protein